MQQGGGGYQQPPHNSGGGYNPPPQQYAPQQGGYSAPQGGGYNMYEQGEGYGGGGYGPVSPRQPPQYEMPPQERYPPKPQHPPHVSVLLLYMVPIELFICTHITWHHYYNIQYKTYIMIKIMFCRFCSWWNIKIVLYCLSKISSLVIYKFICGPGRMSRELMS